MIRAVRPTPVGRPGLLVVYLLATLTTANQGILELLFPLNLDRLGYPLPAVGTLFAGMSLGALLSRLPGGLWYQPTRAAPLSAASLAAVGATTAGLALTDALVVQAGFALLHGVAFGLATTFLLALVVDLQPPARSATPAIAWYTAAISTGYAIGAPAGALLLERFGYAGGIGLAGAEAAVAAGCALALLPGQAPPDVASRGDRAVAQSANAAAARRGSQETPESRARAGRREPFARIGGWWPALHQAIAALPPAIWLATLLGFYLNFVRDAYDAFFPIHAIGLGISLGTIGALKSVHSLAATAIRFGAPLLFATARAGPVNHASVLALAVGTASLAVLTSEPLLFVAFAVLGLSRGLVRVTSAAEVAEARKPAGASVGLASGVYSAGLDLGAMAGPPLAGLLAAAIGIPAALGVVATAVPLAYYAVWFSVRAAARPAPARAEV